MGLIMKRNVPHVIIEYVLHIIVTFVNVRNTYSINYYMNTYFITFGTMNIFDDSELVRIHEMKIIETYFTFRDVI